MIRSVQKFALFIAVLAVASSVNAQVYEGIFFPAGPVSFADVVASYDPAYGGGPVPDVTQQDSRQILGLPGQGEMSLGNGGQIVVQFVDNYLVASGDERPDLWIFGVGAPEYVSVEIRRRSGPWHFVGTTSGLVSGIDIDQFDLPRKTAKYFEVRLTDDGDSGSESFTVGADLVAVGASSSVPNNPWNGTWLKYWIQAHIGGKSELIIQGNTMVWHHIKGTPPGLVRAFHSYAVGANSPTIIDSNQGPNVEWLASGWPDHLGNGTYPEAWVTFDALTPVFPQSELCWKLKKLAGTGFVTIKRQPKERNGYALVIVFDDLGSGEDGTLKHRYLSGSGFYQIELSNTGTSC